MAMPCHASLAGMQLRPLWASPDAAVFSVYQTSRVRSACQHLPFHHTHCNGGTQEHISKHLSKQALVERLVP